MFHCNVHLCCRAGQQLLLQARSQLSILQATGMQAPVAMANLAPLLPKASLQELTQVQLSACMS